MRALEQSKLRPGYDPITVSEKDVAANLKNIRIIPLDAAQLPRSLADTDFSFINGNFALASGLKLSAALAAEKVTPNYQNLVAIRTADKGKPWVRDLEAAYRSRAFLEVTKQQFAGFVQPQYQLGQLAQQTQAAQPAQPSLQTAGK